MKRKLTFLLLTFLFGLQCMVAQNIRVTGVIVSQDDGEPVIGASIMVKGTTQGTITNYDGQFFLDVNQNALLVISYVGMVTQELPVQADMRVVLSPDTQNLEEIVVVGYGTQRKKDVTSSISQLKGEVLADKASPSFMQQMAGRASGVQVISGSGDVTAPPKIIIRGVGTVSSGTEPLYVINGIPISSTNHSSLYTNNNPLGDINPSDIESMEILKDGAATAIYGSRAANGVVLITTKQGKQGSVKVTYDAWFGISKAAKLYDLLNAEQFVEIANEKYLNIGGNKMAFMDDTGTDTNWYDHTFRTGFQHSHSLSVSGATPQTQYYMSAGYTNQKGVVINNAYDRYTFNANIDQKIFQDVISIGFALNAAHQNNEGPVKGTNSLSDNMYASSRMLPNVPVYNSEHPTGYNIDFNDPKSLGQWSNGRTIENTIPNIVWVLKNNKQENSSYRLMPTANIGVKFTDWLRFKSIIGADVSLINDRYVWRPESGDGYGYKGLIVDYNYKRQRWNFQNILSFNRSFGDHNVDATAVAEWTNYKYSSVGASARDFSDPFFVDQIISSTFATPQTYGGWTTNGLASYILRGNYNYKSTVYLGGSVRWDGLSNLHPDNRWGTFYGLSAALRISNFDFWKENPINQIVSDFRLRGSYAEVGNDRLSGNFMYYDFFSGQKYGDQVGIAYSQAGNKNLKWEIQQILDFGFDAAFLNGRFNLVFAYWQKDNKDIVLNVPTPPSLGIPGNTIAQNYGRITNNGIELEIGGNIIQTKDLVWRSSLNISTQNSEIKTLVEEIPYEHRILREGESYNALWGYQYEGVNMVNGNPLYKKADGTIIQGNPADSKYYIYDPSNPSDMSTTSALTTDDKVILGKSIPTWFGGWDNTVTWKNFDLNVFFRFSGGNKIANVSRRDQLDQGFVNNSTEILGRWQSVENPGDGNVPKLYYGKSSFVNLTADGSSRWIEDGKFLKLQNVAVGYTFPKNLCKSMLIEKLRVYVQAQNLFTITGYSGLDPESYTGSHAGIDWSSNPQQRLFVLGLNVGF